MTNATESLSFHCFADLHSRSWALPTSRKKSWSKAGYSPLNAEQASGRKSLLSAGKPEYSGSQHILGVMRWPTRRNLFGLVAPGLFYTRLETHRITLENSILRARTWRPLPTSTLLAPKMHWPRALEPRGTHNLLHMVSKAATWTQQTVTQESFKVLAKNLFKVLWGRKQCPSSSPERRGITHATVSFRSAPWPHHSPSQSGRWPSDSSGTSSWMARKPEHPAVIQKVSATEKPSGSRINDFHYSIHQVSLKPSIMSLHFKQGTRSFITSPNPCPQKHFFQSYRICLQSHY